MSEPKITPLARRLAEENGIDWRKLQGTGPEGEITERDILDFLAKVMAGEVTLEGPPPGEPPPPEGEADLEAARAALEKEGVPLDELIPKEQQERPPAEATAEFELELDLLEETAEAPAAEEGRTAEPLPSEEAAGAPAPDEITAELPAYPEARTAEPEPVPDITAELPVFTEEDRTEEPAPEITAELPVYGEEAPEETVQEPPKEEVTAELPVFREAEPPPAETEPGVAAAPSAGEAEPGPAEEAPAAPPPELPLWFRPVALEALDALLADFGAELGRKLPRSALLFLAARRALADLEVPLRPLKGRYRVDESENFAGFVAAWEAASEEGEGLAVEEAEPPIHLKAPALVLASGGLPEGQGLLILAGELPTAEEKFLARVAHYLEKPIRLLLFG